MFRCTEYHYSALANSCPLQTEAFIFSIIHCHHAQFYPASFNRVTNDWPDKLIILIASSIRSLYKSKNNSLSYLQGNLCALWQFMHVVKRQFLDFVYFEGKGFILFQWGSVFFAIYTSFFVKCVAVGAMSPDLKHWLSSQVAVHPRHGDYQLI